MKSKVYFIPVNDSDSFEAVKEKFGRLLDASKILDCVAETDKVAVKLHFGEEGNTGFVKPEYVRQACERIRMKKATPFLVDTNTLYRGRRTNVNDHTQLAYEHGFVKENTAAEVLISDESCERNLNGKFIKVAKVCKIFFDFPVLLGIAHFKGHIMTGFGGALKNIGMGCASRTGKLAQHSDVSPFVKQKFCIGCETCIGVCPAAAISVAGKKARIDGKKCIGCASCIAACLENAIEVEWEKGGVLIQEKIIEYAKAVLQEKVNKAAFINFATKITKECDCLAKDDPRISPDVGIFASVDPVSIDKANLDAVNQICGRDVFKEAHPYRNGLKQLEYAAQIGLGSLEYELICL